MICYSVQLLLNLCHCGGSPIVSTMLRAMSPDPVCTSGKLCSDSIMTQIVGPDRIDPIDSDDELFYVCT